MSKLNVKITYACKGWLNLPFGEVFEAERLVGDRGVYWYIPNLDKDVPDYAVQVVSSCFINKK